MFWNVFTEFLGNVSVDGVTLTEPLTVDLQLRKSTKQSIYRIRYTTSPCFCVDVRLSVLTLLLFRPRRRIDTFIFERDVTHDEHPPSHLSTTQRVEVGQLQPVTILHDRHIVVYFCPINVFVVFCARTKYMCKHYAWSTYIHVCTRTCTGYWLLTHTRGSRTYTVYVIYMYTRFFVFNAYKTVILSAMRKRPAVYLCKA